MRSLNQLKEIANQDRLDSESQEIGFADGIIDGEKVEGRREMEKQAIAKAYQDGQSAAKRGFIGDIYNQYSGARYPELWESWKNGNESLLENVDGEAV